MTCALQNFVSKTELVTHTILFLAEILFPPEDVCHCKYAGARGDVAMDDLEELLKKRARGLLSIRLVSRRFQSIVHEVCKRDPVLRCVSWTPEDWEAAARRLTPLAHRSIRTLQLRQFCVGVDEVEKLGDVWSKLQNLERLDFDVVRVLPDARKLYDTFGGLYLRIRESLRILRWHCGDAFVLNTVRGAPNLEVLSYFATGTPHTFPLPPKTESSVSWPQLHTLRIFSRFNQSTLERRTCAIFSDLAGDEFPSLKRLEVNGGSSFRDLGVFIRRNQLLESLWLASPTSALLSIDRFYTLPFLQVLGVRLNHILRFNIDPQPALAHIHLYRSWDSTATDWDTIYDPCRALVMKFFVMVDMFATRHSDFPCLRTITLHDFPFETLRNKRWSMKAASDLVKVWRRASAANIEVLDIFGNSLQPSCRLRPSADDEADPPFSYIVFGIHFL